MRIVGGTFGARGSARISRNKKLLVRGALRREYGSNDIVSIDSVQEEHTKTSCLSIVVGVFILALLTLLFNVIGFVVGLLIMFFGSRYKVVNDFVTIKFSDGQKIKLYCSPRQVNKLMRFNSDAG